MITILNSNRITAAELADLTAAAHPLLVNVGAPAHAFDPIERRLWLDAKDEAAKRKAN